MQQQHRYGATPQLRRCQQHRHLCATAASKGRAPGVVVTASTAGASRPLPGKKKKPGRVAGKQSGAAYYQNYLRNRKAKGGEFLGPPLQLLLPDEQSLAASANARQQEPQPQPQVSSRGGDDVSQPAVTVTTPAGLQQLLEQCLDAATHVSSQHQHQQQQEQQQEPPQELNPLQQQRQQSKQRQPWQLPDYVSAELADGLVLLLKPRRGVTVEPPQLTTAEPLIPLPPLPALPSQRNTRATSSSSHSDGTLSASGADSSSSTDDVSTTQPLGSGRRVLLHVFWDLSSLHPGGYDPRVVVAQLRRVMACYGEVAGVYAYGIQKLFNWVPEAFLAQYAPDRLPGRRASQQQQYQRQQQLQTATTTTISGEQQQDLRQLLLQAARVGVSLEDSVGPLRCRVCGKLRANHRQLHTHMLQRHKQAAPPLDKLLPEGALAGMLAAAIADATAAAAASSARSSGGSSGAAGGQQSQQQQPAAAAAARSPHSWKVADPWVMRNSSTRTLGRVSRYFNSSGDQFLPPDGHQISLKYVLVREGVEVRTVQRQARAVSAAVADALHNTLHGQVLARSAAEVQLVQDVFVVVSDKGTHAAVLQEARRAGVQTVAVCGKMREFKGADVSLRWQWVVAGRYDCGGGDGGGGGGGGTEGSVK